MKKTLALFLLATNLAFSQALPPEMIKEGKKMPLEQFLMFGLSSDSLISQLSKDTCFLRVSFAKFSINRKLQVEKLFFLPDSSNPFKDNYYHMPTLVKERIEYYLRMADGKWSRKSVGKHFFMPIILRLDYNYPCNKINLYNELIECFYAMNYISYDKENEAGYFGYWRLMKARRFYGTILNPVNIQPQKL